MSYAFAWKKTTILSFFPGKNKQGMNSLDEILYSLKLPSRDECLDYRML